jgi:hypothetical protein
VLDSHLSDEKDKEEASAIPQIEGLLICVITLILKVYTGLEKSCLNEATSEALLKATCKVYKVLWNLAKYVSFVCPAPHTFV